MYYLQTRKNSEWFDLKSHGCSIQAENLSKLLSELIIAEFNPDEIAFDHGFRIVKREFKIVDYLESEAPKTGGLWYLQLRYSDVNSWQDAHERSTAITAQNLSTLIQRIIEIPARLTMTAQYRVIYRVVEIVETVVS